MDFCQVNLFCWDYLVVDCGYVERLYKYADEIKEETAFENDEGEDDHALMFFVNYDYDPKTKESTYHCHPHQADPDHVYDALLGLIQTKRLNSVQAVCFKQADLDVGLVTMLTEYQHCGCFGEHPYLVASFKTETGKTVLYQKFDTESG